MKPILLELAESEEAAAAQFDQHVAACPVCRPISLEPTTALCATGQALVNERNAHTDALLMSHAFPQRSADA